MMHLLEQQDNQEHDREQEIPNCRTTATVSNVEPDDEESRLQPLNSQKEWPCVADHQ